MPMYSGHIVGQPTFVVGRSGYSILQVNIINNYIAVIVHWLEIYYMNIIRQQLYHVQE